jgi:catalase
VRACEVRSTAAARCTEALASVGSHLHAFTRMFFTQSPQAGIKNITSDAAEAIRGRDPDHTRRDLVTHLRGGGQAAWKMFVQAIPEEDVAGYKVRLVECRRIIRCRSRS